MNYLINFIFQHLKHKISFFVSQFDIVYNSYTHLFQFLQLGITINRDLTPTHNSIIIAKPKTYIDIKYIVLDICIKTHRKKMSKTYFVNG